MAALGLGNPLGNPLAKPRVVNTSAGAINYGLIQKSGNFWRRLHGNILIGSQTRMAWNGSIFVGLGGSSATFSSNGLNWTTGTQADMIQVSDLTSGNSLFIGVGVTGSTSQRVITSPDGAVWTTRTTPTSTNGFQCCVFGGGTFVAIGGSTEAMSSTDGINWTARTRPSGGSSYNKIAYGNGLFVAVSYGAISSVNPILTSPDGINWTLRTVPSKEWYGIAWNGRLFCAVGTESVMTSTDGINWTERTCPASQDWRAVEWNGTVFAAVSRSASFTAVVNRGYRVMTSPDGINWTLKPSPVDADWLSLASNNDIFVAAGVSEAMTSNININ